MNTRYHIYFYVPESHIKPVKQAMFDAGAGCIGDYSECCWQTKGTGQYLPHDTATPYKGRALEVSFEPEYKVEIICKSNCIEQVVSALKESHPYEEPAYGVIQLEPF